MPQKFISFLGAIPYQETRYYFDTGRKAMAEPTPYVQEAILTMGITGWDAAKDKVLIFTTPEAFANNYENRILRFDREKMQPVLAKGEGLESKLLQLQQKSIIGEYHSITIPNGNNEAEIWEVFQAVYDCLEPGDEVYLDITYGFRSLPMLGITLLNYAKALQHVRVKAIYYGNYEAGRAELQSRAQQAKKGQNGDSGQAEAEMVEAPVINLMPFAELQEWTYAARTFLESGNARPLSGLVSDQDENLSQELHTFSQALSACRGGALAQDLKIGLLKQVVSIGQQMDIEQQLRPLLAEIEKKIAPFESGSLANGLAAVQWCIDHGLLQQGITFLQETLISYVVDHTLGRGEVNNQFFRLLAGFALNGARKLPKDFLQKSKQFSLSLSKTQIEGLFQSMQQWVRSKGKLIKHYQKLTGRKGFRNDINHCGFRDGYLSPDELTEKLKSLFENIQQLKL